MTSNVILPSIKRLYSRYGMRGIMHALLLRLPLINLPVRWWLGDHNWIGKWIEHTGNTVHIGGCNFSVDSPLISTAFKSRFILNRYEEEEQISVKRFVVPELPVVELGASIGIISCLTNKRLKDPTQHVVVEANPHLLPLLINNRNRNACHFEVLSKALAYGSDHIHFHTSESHTCGSTQSKTEGTVNDVVVPTVTLEAILDQYAFKTITLICDIEGAEADLIANEPHILSNRVACFILEVHPDGMGHEAVDALTKKVEELGFCLSFKKNDVRVYSNRNLT